MKNGLFAKSIWLPGNEGRADGVIAKNGLILETLNEFHGEYDIDWIIQKENGVEVARHNTKYIETIIWEEHDPFPEKAQK
uniref:Uncharacterized protein n=1 Tax=viral metagenome TaxID=1070528 RepID=A0A6H1ZA13_9ZZZZ